jgi:hypothetical protein
VDTVVLTGVDVAAAIVPVATAGAGEGPAALDREDVGSRGHARRAGPQQRHLLGTEHAGLGREERRLVRLDGSRRLFAEHAVRGGDRKAHQREVALNLGDRLAAHARSDRAKRGRDVRRAAPFAQRAPLGLQVAQDAPALRP